MGKPTRLASFFSLPFGKKQQQEEEDERTVDLTTKKVKAKAKKKPPKPWTKKDRLIILALLLTTSLPAAFLALSARAFRLPNMPHFDFPSLSKTFEFSSPDTTIKFDPSPAIASFKSLIKPLSGVYGFYVVRLTSTDSYGYLENSDFQAASLIKLPVMIAAFRQAESGNLNLEEEYSLKSGDKIAGAGSLYSKPEGTIVTYEELLRLMGKLSDNTAFGIIRSTLGDDTINQVVTELGLSSTSLEENSTSPKDTAVIFERLYNSNYLTKDHSEKMLEYLTDTAYESWLTPGVPNDIRIAHKYGREVHVVNDAGIVFADNPYVIVILTKGIVESEADAIFPELSRIIYEFEISNQ